jgi:hypothetical protein
MYYTLAWDSYTCMWIVRMSVGGFGDGRAIRRLTSLAYAARFMRHAAKHGDPCVMQYF